MTVYYASPTGTGNGLSQGSPFKITNFVSVAVAGDHLFLLDGIYADSNGIINVVQGIANNGTQANPITISALNDGNVYINGQGVRRPVYLAKKWWIVEGIDAGNSSAEVYGVVGESNIVRRCCGWNASDSGNVAVFDVYNGNQYSGNPDETGQSNLIEDCGGFGTGRKIFQSSAGADYSTIRRCFGRIEGSSSTAGPRCAFDAGYSAIYNLVENCISTMDLDRALNSSLFEDIGGLQNFGRTITGDCVQHTKFLGCIGYLLASQTGYVDGTQGGLGTVLRTQSWFDYVDSIIYIEPGAHTGIAPFNMLDWDGTGGGCGASNPFPGNRKVTRVASIGGDPSLSSLGSDIIYTNFSQNNSLSALYGAQSIYSNDGTKPTVRYRYVDGTLTNVDLWPWPMNSRIIGAFNRAGRTAIDVNSTIQNIFGNFPTNISPLSLPLQDNMNNKVLRVINF